MAAINGGFTQAAMETIVQGSDVGVSDRSRTRAATAAAREREMTNICNVTVGVVIVAVNKGDISRSSAEVHPLPTHYFLSHAADAIKQPVVTCECIKARDIKYAVLRELVVECERRRGHFTRARLVLHRRSMLLYCLLHCR